MIHNGRLQLACLKFGFIFPLDDDDIDALSETIMVFKDKQKQAHQNLSQLFTNLKS